MTAKKEYNMLLKNGILLELYPEFTGDWSMDEDSFTKLHEANLFFIEPLEVDDYEEI